MLAFSLIDLHFAGGIEYMFPLFLMLVANFCIIVYLLLARSQKKQFNNKWLEAIKQIGGLAAVWGVFGTIIGLFQAFDSLEAMKEILPFQVIMGGLKVAVITAIYGLSIYCISLLVYILLKLTNKNLAA
jgi:biopolymer transport protein ExbB/TolQ